MLVLLKITLNHKVTGGHAWCGLPDGDGNILVSLGAEPLLGQGAPTNTKKSGGKVLWDCGYVHPSSTCIHCYFVI